MTSQNTRIKQFNAKALLGIEQQNRQILANCNVWAAALRDGKTHGIDTDLATPWAAAAHAVTIFGHRFTDTSTRLKVTGGFELRASSTLMLNKPAALIQVGTPGDLLTPFEEPRPYFTMIAMDTTVSDIPQGPSATDAEMRKLIDTFREGWADERYDYPGEVMQLVYLTTFVEMAEHYRLRSNSDDTHITQANLVDRKISLEHLKVDVGEYCYTYGMYFKLTDKKAAYLQLTVFLDNVRKDTVANFDHVPYRALIEERNRIGL